MGTAAVNMLLYTLIFNDSLINCELTLPMQSSQKIAIKPLVFKAAVAQQLLLQLTCKYFINEILNIFLQFRLSSNKLPVGVLITFVVFFFNPAALADEETSHCTAETSEYYAHHSLAKGQNKKRHQLQQLCQRDDFIQQVTRQAAVHDGLGRPLCLMTILQRTKFYSE